MVCSQPPCLTSLNISHDHGWWECTVHIPLSQACMSQVGKVSVWDNEWANLLLTCVLKRHRIVMRISGFATFLKPFLLSCWDGLWVFLNNHSSLTVHLTPQPCWLPQGCFHSRELHSFQKDHSIAFFLIVCLRKPWPLNQVSPHVYFKFSLFIHCTSLHVLRSYWVFSSCKWCKWQFRGLLWVSFFSTVTAAFLFQGAWWYHSYVAIFGPWDPWDLPLKHTKIWSRMSFCLTFCNRVHSLLLRPFDFSCIIMDKDHKAGLLGPSLQVFKVVFFFFSYYIEKCFFFIPVRLGAASWKRSNFWVGDL